MLSRLWKLGINGTNFHGVIVAVSVANGRTDPMGSTIKHFLMTVGTCWVQWLNIQVRHTLRMGHWADIASLLGESSESFPDELSRVLNHCDKSRFLLLEKELGKRSPHCVIDLLIQHAPEYVGSFGPVHGQTLLHTAVTHDNKKSTSFHYHGSRPI